MRPLFFAAEHAVFEARRWMLAFDSFWETPRKEKLMKIRSLRSSEYLQFSGASGILSQCLGEVGQGSLDVLLSWLDMSQISVGPVGFVSV